jgi:type II secretory pathway predicted ATPase ExeA
MNIVIRVQIVFVGLPEFVRKLNSQRSRQTKPEVMVKRQITALSKEQSEKYIDHRLQRVGSKSSKIFTAKAFSKIVIYHEAFQGPLILFVTMSFGLDYLKKSSMRRLFLK